MEEPTSMLQSTVLKSVHAEGVALHSGRRVSIALHPADPGSGVRFRRVDLADSNMIEARPGNVVDARLGVRLRNEAGAEAMTVEHFLAAASLLGLDNVLVDIDAAELPIFDGSLCQFAQMIDEAGLAVQNVARRTIAVREALRVEDGDRFVEIAPSSQRRIDMTIDYPAAAIGWRRVTLDPDDPTQRKRIINARTFCTLSDIEGMRARGFALGGSLDNAIVVDGGRIINEAPLRDAEEFALHKTADLIGDLALVGARVEGAVTAHKTGHELNTRLARRIAALDPA
ncbi:MAG: UDP-3-O-[3-hydroxymyristoyl] N-acetylglucosamine deacetylase [Parvularculaceae bacterium]|nr:UDP-3-O-[3-hydroxymyristoyl] N-acetylglucosamine deacetylase [Parvularculaceae bacterium]